MSLAKRCYVVDHMEDELWEWCVKEYQHMIRQVGGEHMWFSHVGQEGDARMQGARRSSERFSQIMATHGIERAQVCLLDSEAPVTLEPADAGVFQYFLFGGILGDVDECDFDGTSELRDLGFPRRNLGQAQMTTDTAVIVTHRILSGTPMSDLVFIDRPEFRINDKERFIMPFKYLKDDHDHGDDEKDMKEKGLTGKGKPLMPEGMEAFLREEHAKGFDLM